MIPQLRQAKKKPANGRLLITEHPVMSFVNRIGRTNFIVLVLLLVLVLEFLIFDYENEDEDVK